MGHVEYAFGRRPLGRHDLETSRPTGFSNATFDHFWRNQKSLMAENFRGGNCQRDVSQLMPANEWRFHENLLPHYW
jgi:hypothetical protein